MKIVEDAGYENFVLQREDKNGTLETLIAHVSFLATYSYLASLRKQLAKDLNAQLEYEDHDEGAVEHGAKTEAPIRAATGASDELGDATEYDSSFTANDDADGYDGADVTTGRHHSEISGVSIFEIGGVGLI
ncbi:hypothetical protein PInf_008877 [Phytophthora infestans]|nr:hypothetical protein PInf_008877 [Phytophthora infestans]